MENPKNCTILIKIDINVTRSNMNIGEPQAIRSNRIAEPNLLFQIKNIDIDENPTIAY